jgi:hypothetical protein|tara:strand:+ start:116 stop:652 length:537 start_codon:yes stop_codon:yes gene_type:complete
MTATIPDPVENNVERVLVRSTATGMEQGVAAAAGLFMAGPIGALASWGAIRGLQGKWTPWFVIGIPASIAINVVNFVAVVGIMGVMAPAEYEEYGSGVDSYEQSLGAPSSSRLPHYNVSDKVGDTTLVQKCQQLQRAQNAGDLGEIMRISAAIGWNHDTPWNTDVDQDCASVGVDTVM